MTSTLVHDFHGACDDIGRHGALRHAQNPDRVLIDAAKRKVDNYRLDYLQDEKAFLPLIASTSGRLHGEFVRFLYFLAHTPWTSLPLSARRIRRTTSCVSNAVRSSTSIGPASASRAPKLLHCGLALLLHHAGKRPFRAPMHTRCRRTSMPTGVDNRLAQGWLGCYI